MGQIIAMPDAEHGATDGVAGQAVEETALTGEVMISEESTAAAKAAALKENESIIKKNWAKATEKVNTVYRALTVIHTYDLWKQHKDANGKRKYSAFDKYLFGEFGWELSRVRALQIIKATRSEMIAAGEISPEAAESRTRTAPEVTSERAAKVTADQLQRVLDAFSQRVDNIDDGDTERQAILDIFETVRDALAPAITDLREIVFAAEAADAETPATEESDDDDDDDDDDTAE